MFRNCRYHLTGQCCSTLVDDGFPSSGKRIQNLNSKINKDKEQDSYIGPVMKMILFESYIKKRDRSALTDQPQNCFFR